METLLQTCLQGTVLALFVLLVRPLLLTRVPKLAFHLLWACVLARLLVPWSIPLDADQAALLATSLFSGTPTNPAPAEAGFLEPGATTYANPPSNSGPFGLTGTAAAALQALPCALWIAGALAFASRLAVATLCRRRTLKGARPLDVSLLSAQLKRHRIRRSVVLVESPEAAVPYTFGTLRPVVVVPPGWFSQDERTARRILAVEHELVHVKRFDAAFKATFALACCLYWFNPVVWAAYACMQRDIELSCDERVLHARNAAERALYAHGLLDAVQAGRMRPAATLGFSSHCVEERIASIAKGRQGGSAALVALLACFALAAAPCVCTAQNESGVVIDQGLYTVEIPREWAEHVEVATTGELTLNVHIVGHPELPLLWTETTRASEPIRKTYGGSAIIGTLVFGDVRVELWVANYAGLSQSDSWFLSWIVRPEYPGRELERLVVDLTCGGQFTLEELWEMDPGVVGDPDLPIVDGFDYYEEVIAPTFAAK